MEKSKRHSNKGKEVLNWGILSKYRGEIYGLTIIWIMLLHGSIMDKVEFSKAFEPVYVVLKHGNVGVDIFLFLSGISLYYSFQKNSSLSAYLTKRLSRILIPVLLIGGAFFGFYDWYLEGDIHRFFNDITLLRFWFKGDHLIWYANMILLCYFLYPYLYAYFFEKKDGVVWLRAVLLLAVVVGFTFGFRESMTKVYQDLEIALTRLPIFIIGTACGRLVFENRKFPLWGYFIAFLVVVTSYPIFINTIFVDIWQRYYYALYAISLCFVFAIIIHYLKMKVVHSILIWFGGISFELYLIHILIRHYFMHSPYYHGNVWYKWLVILVVCVILAYLVSLIEKGIHLIIAKLSH